MSRISKIVSGVGVILVLLGAVGTPAAASAIYTVNRPSIGPALAHLTGELVTDGTLGSVPGTRTFTRKRWGVAPNPATPRLAIR